MVKSIFRNQFITILARSVVGLTAALGRRSKRNPPRISNKGFRNIHSLRLARASKAGFSSIVEYLG